MRYAALALLVALTVPDDLVSIRIDPAELVIGAPHRVLVSGERKDGLTVDVAADLSVADPRVARVEGSRLCPVADGSTTLTASAGKLTASARVTVKIVARRPDFALQVLPWLTRLGCNSGACHGSAKGQNNFKLSLLGYDADADYAALAMELRSRRINRAHPEESLMLEKPTLKVKHGGGMPLKADSDEYRVLLDWIKAGAPRRTRDETLASIDVFPDSRILPLDAEQPILVVARYSDGSNRDVTGQALFSTNDDSIATVTPQGVARTRGRGETVIVVRYGGHVKPVRIGSPVGESAGSKFETANFVDEILARKWSTLRLQPAGRASDAEFQRRAYLDAVGTLPTPDETRAFLRNPDRVKLVDALLARPEFVAFWTHKLCEWLLVGGPDKPRPEYVEWIRAQVSSDAPLSDVARALLSSPGNAAPSSYYRVSNDPREMMEFTIQTFHGFRMQCAQCHNHPLERFSQNEYHALSAFFARVRQSRDGIELAPRGELTHPGTGRPVVPRLPNGTAPDPDKDRRSPLAGWLVEDRRFARAFANRIWGEIFGRGLVHPVDDMRASNPAAVPELLEALADEFSKSFRIRPFVRTLMTSNAYGLGSKGADERFFARAIVRPLGAEVLLDAIASATGVPNEFGRAIEAIDGAARSDYSLEVFGRCPRTSACTLKGEYSGSLRKALHLISDDVISGRVKRARLAASDPELVEDLYLRALCRPPSEKEKAHWSELFKKGPRDEMAQDLFWALLASNEFQFRH